jgi:cell wall-associated NlpC family hydrolase
MTTRQQIIDEARTWLNVRWVHQGRSRAGVDCIGIVIKVAHALDIFTFDTFDYSRQPDPNRLRELIGEHMDKIMINDARIGDVLLMRFEREPQHVAFVTDAGILHAYAQVRRVVEHGFDDIWRSRVVGAYRYRGLED